MMALSFDMQLLGLRAVRDEVDAMRDRARDTRVARKLIGEELLARNQERLARGVDMDGKPFNPPSRRVQQFGGQTMWDDGNLESHTSFDLTGDGVELFSTDIRAAVHWKGKTIKPKRGKYLTLVFRGEDGSLEFRKVRQVKMPARRYFGINEHGDLDAATEILGNHVMGGRER